MSSGEKKIYRLSRRGNRRLNHAIHMAAVTQIHFANSPGRAYYERKRAEGKTGKEAIRALKRRISDVIYARLVADAKAAGTWNRGPGGQPGNVSKSSATGSHPAKPALRNKPLPDHPQHYDPPDQPTTKETPPSLLTQRGTRSVLGREADESIAMVLQIGQGESVVVPDDDETPADVRSAGNFAGLELRR